MGFFSSLFSKKSRAAAPVGDPIGEVTHYYGHLGVAIVRFTKPVKVGATVRFRGATTDFTETIRSLQYDHRDIAEAKRGQEVGVKVVGKVREGDKVYEG